MRIVYFGTPEFAVAPLQKLVESGHNIVGIVTAPDKPAGRGKKIKTSAVKDYAIKTKIPVLQPQNLKDEGFISELKKLEANLFIVVAFRMLPNAVWQMPKYGTFNLHASLLPNYRGAAPINRVIMNGETKTGVTTFFLEQTIDTGAIILQKETDILPDENAGNLHDRLMKIGAELVLDTVELIKNKKALIKPQSELIKSNGELNLAPKIFKEDMEICWDNSCKNIYNKIRGLSPYPGAFTNFYPNQHSYINLKIYEAEFLIDSNTPEPGTVETDGKKYFKIACSDGFIIVKEMQQQGKKRLPVKAFLAGFNFNSGYCK
jgi:methionyl-tRNA formyltransferase